MKPSRRNFVVSSAVPLAAGLALASKSAQAQSSSLVLPCLTIELGHSAQQNGGRGIDCGNYYQPDYHIGTNNYNNFPCTINSNGTFTLTQRGVYMVCGYAHIVTPDGSDLYQLPAQITLAMGTGYAWPGVYQQAVQAFPSPALGSQNVSSLGSISLAGTTPGFGTDNPIWLGFSKVAGSQYGKTLGLQGTIAITKVG